MSQSHGPDGIQGKSQSSNELVGRNTEPQTVWKSRRTGWVLGVAIVAAGAGLFGLRDDLWAQGGRSGAEGQELQCRMISDIQRLYLKRHIQSSELTPALEKRVAEQWVKRLDGAKIYLTQADVDSIQAMMSGHFSRLSRSDCKVFTDSYNLFTTRVQERTEYARTQLQSEKWKFNPKTELQLDPDKRVYPKSVQEANAFQDRYLQFQVSNYLATNQPEAEARKNVVKNYERNLKQLREKKADELLSDYLDAFARALDPHSSYFSREGKEEFELI